MQTFAADTGDEPMVISYLEGQDDQIPNPWKDYKTLKDAEDATGFSIKLPKKITGYKKSVIQAVDQEILQVYYEKGEEEVLIRKAVISQGKDIRNDGTYSYSVSTSNGMSQKALLKIVKQVQ